MRIATTALGLFIGLGGAVGITLSQAETKTVQGQPRRVVASVNRSRVTESPVLKRCLWVGIPAALVGAGIGYLATSGVHLGAAFLGAFLFSALSASWRENWAEKFGRAGENAQVSDIFLHGLVGGLLAAAGAAYWTKQMDRLPGRLPTPEDAARGCGRQDR